MFTFFTDMLSKIRNNMFFDFRKKIAFKKNFKAPEMKSYSIRLFIEIDCKADRRVISSRKEVFRTFFTSCLSGRQLFIRKCEKD